MFSITQVLPAYWHKFPKQRRYVYLILSLYILPLLLFNSHQNSLMAHDEGLYAVRAKLMFDTGDWVHPWSTPHHKTPGPYWLIAIVYTVFGISEISVRLPSMVLGFLSMILVYEIGKIILNQNLAFLATIILGLEFLWLQYCRLGNPDIPMIFLVLLAILCWLKSENNPQKQQIYGLIAGFSLGLGFLVRSLMMVLPIAALFPYLILNHKVPNQKALNQKPDFSHLTNPFLYLGFFLGLLPTVIWLYLNLQHYGVGSINELLGFAVRLGSNERGGNNFLFYLWNIPLKSFPWGLLAIAGAIILYRRPISSYNSILLGFPLTLFTLLSFVSTRLSHYSLLLYPFIALLAAVGIDSLRQTYLQAIAETNPKKPRTRFIATISNIAVILAFIMIFAGVVVITLGKTEVLKYTTIAIACGIGFLVLPITWKLRDRFPNPQIASQYWLAGLIIPFWLGLAATGSSGLINDYNPQVKQLVSQPLVAQILKRHPVNFVNVGGKTGVLLNFYTPRHGRISEEISHLQHNSYAWVPTKQIKNANPPHRLIAGTKEYSLIQVQRPVVLGVGE